MIVMHRTTLWCLGCLVHEMLSGQPPFIADDQPTLFLLIGDHFFYNDDDDDDNGQPKWFLLIMMKT